VLLLAALTKLRGDYGIVAEAAYMHFGQAVYPANHNGLQTARKAGPTSCPTFTPPQGVHRTMVARAAKSFQIGRAHV
jgi:hypothetical protein